MVENINEINFNDNKPYLAPHYPFSLEGHWQPWYDDRRDYNTNAPTYYDYLSNFNKLIKDITELLNRVARRNIEVEDTNSVDLTKINDWIDEGNTCHSWHDVITLKADVILSTYQKAINFDGKSYHLTNAISCMDSGLYASDYLPLIQALADKLNKDISDNNDKFKDLQEQINRINQEITNIKNIINTIKGDITNIKNDISNIKGDITNINNRIDNLSTFAAAAIQPPLVNIPMTIKNNKLTDSLSVPPDKKKGIDYASIKVEYEEGKFKKYEYFKVGIKGYDFNSVNVNDTILTIPIAEAKKHGISDSLINQAKVFNWTLTSGYTQGNSFNQLGFGIRATTEASGNGDLEVYLFKNQTSGAYTGAMSEDNINHVIVNITNVDN